MSVLRWRKRPIVIEAFSFATPQAGLAPGWLLDAIRDGQVCFRAGDAPHLAIKTLEGEVRADLGDWIIRGVEGELYPCKPTIFAATYEPADAPLPPPPRDEQVDGRAIGGRR